MDGQMLPPERAWRDCTTPAHGAPIQDDRQDLERPKKAPVLHNDTYPTFGWRELLPDRSPPPIKLALPLEEGSLMSRRKASCFAHWRVRIQANVF